MTRIILFVVAGIMAGMTQGALFFSNYGAGESLLTRLALSLSIAIISGALFGYFLKSLWWFAVISVWLPLLFSFSGFRDLIVGRGGSAGFLHSSAMLLPLAVVLAAGYFGAWANQNRRFKIVLVMLLAGILGIAGSILFVSYFAT